MSEKSIIIIGAGLSGLAAGCYARMNGYEAHIFEHHTKPGGVAAAWKRKGFHIDGGIHFLMGHKPGQSMYELYRELGTAQVNNFLDMPVYIRFVDQATGRTITVTEDLNRLEEEVRDISEVDAPFASNLVSMAKSLGRVDMMKMGLEKPPELVRIWDRIRGFWNTGSLSKYMFGKNAGSMEAYARGVKDPWVAWVFENLFLPEVPVWFVGMLLGLIAGRQMGLMEGGSSGFVKPIEERFKNLGGHINYGATVEEILVEEDTAVGILLDCGETYRADAVVSAADGYRTIFKMLGGRYLDQKIEKRYKEWKLIRPLVMVNFGVDREFEGDPWLTAIKLERPLKEGARSVDSLMVRLFNYSREFAPPGKTVVQATYETEWEFWRDLHSDRKKYEAEKERISGEIKDRLESFYPGISSRIEMTDVATPHTTWRYTLNHRGAYEGWLPEPRVINTTIQRTLPGLNNFYMAGQWVMPGGGVPTCIVSGRHVVQILCRQDKKRFTTSLP